MQQFLLFQMALYSVSWQVKNLTQLFSAVLNQQLSVPHGVRLISGESELFDIKTQEYMLLKCLVKYSSLYTFFVLFSIFINVFRFVAAADNETFTVKTKLGNKKNLSAATSNSRLQKK